jgi:hypothetical protein
MTKNELNDKLLKHYDCFQRERFYLDWINDDGVGIQTSSISDSCPPKLCKGIARFVKRALGDSKVAMIYVGPYFYPWGSL